MADLAAVFHWSPPVMVEMSLEELADWRERAIQRSGAE